MIATFSLGWRIEHDAPLLLYAAWLIDEQGLTPYRDFFEQNLPATYLIYVLVGRLTGYADGAVRLFDLGYLAAVPAATWAVLRGFGQRAAWAAGALVGLAYLGYGPAVSLQREFLMLLPLSLAVAALVAPLPTLGRGDLAGLGSGLATAIKPHAVLALPLFLFFVWLDTPAGLQRATTRLDRRRPACPA